MFSLSSTIPVTYAQPSICIPRVFDNITEARIRKTFDALKIAVIAKVDIVERTGKDGIKIKRVYVHFSSWNNSSDAIKAREILISGKDLKIVYDDPWFWKVSASTWSPKLVAVATKSVAKDSTIRIDFDEQNVNAANQLMASLFLSPPTSIASALPDLEELEEGEVVPYVQPLVKNPDMVIRMTHAFRCEVTDDVYRNNVQSVRDQLRSEQDREEDTQPNNEFKIHSNTKLCQPRKKKITVLSESK